MDDPDRLARSVDWGAGVSDGTHAGVLPPLFVLRPNFVPLIAA